MVFLLKNINTECKFIREVRVNLSFNFARYPSCGNFTFQAQFENSLFVKCADFLTTYWNHSGAQTLINSFFLYPGTFKVSNFS